MPRDGLRDDGGQLLAQLLDLGAQIRILQVATSKLGARSGKFTHEDAHLLASVGERSLADARGHIPLLLAKLHGLHPKVRISP